MLPHFLSVNKIASFLFLSLHLSSDSIQRSFLLKSFKKKKKKKKKENAAALAPSLSLSHSLSLSLSFLPLPLSCSAFLESFPLWFLGCLLVISIQYEMVVVLYVDIILNKQKKIMYMYTHIELWLSSVLLLLKEKRRGPTSGGDSAGNMTFK